MQTQLCGKAAENLASCININLILFKFFYAHEDSETSCQNQLLREIYCSTVPSWFIFPFGYCWWATTLKKLKATIIILYAALFIPVQWNTAEVQDWCCGEQDIEGCPDQAEHLPIDPVVLNQLNSSKWHHQHWHQQVRKGKGNNEIIGLDFPARQITKLGGRIVSVQHPLHVDRDLSSCLGLIHLITLNGSF